MTFATFASCRTGPASKISAGASLINCAASSLGADSQVSTSSGSPQKTDFKVR